MRQPPDAFESGVFCIISSEIHPVTQYAWQLFVLIEQYTVADEFEEEKVRAANPVATNIAPNSPDRPLTFESDFIRSS